MTRRSPLAPVLVASALLAAGCAGSGSAAPVTVSSPAAYRYHGLRPSSPLPRPEFTLTDTAGRRFDFRTATTGRATLLFFGYTHCPAECPTTMADIAQSLRRADRGVAERVRVIFVTTDPGRDTGPVLRRWLDRFDGEVPVRFTGLVGTPAQVHAAETAAGVPLSEPDQVPGGGYAVSHAAVVLAYAVDDRAHVLYPAGTAVSTYRADLPGLLQSRQPA